MKKTIQIKKVLKVMTLVVAAMILTAPAFASEVVSNGENTSKSDPAARDCNAKMPERKEVKSSDSKSSSGSSTTGSAA